MDAPGTIEAERIPVEPRVGKPAPYTEMPPERSEDMNDRTQDDAPEKGEEGEVPPPVGTLFLMMLYLMLIAGMWAAIYFEFLGR